MRKKSQSRPTFTHTPPPPPWVCIHKLTFSRRISLWSSQQTNEKNLRFCKILSRRKSRRTGTKSCQHQRSTELDFSGEQRPFLGPLLGRRWRAEPQAGAGARRPREVALRRESDQVFFNYEVANTHLKGESRISLTNSACFQFNFKNLTLPNRNVGPYSFLK